MEHIEGLFVDIRYAQRVGYLLELETKVPEDTEAISPWGGNIG